MAPGLALVLVVVACTLLGDALQDALQPTRIAASPGSWSDDA
jgi:ABC-type dipeptide/oligopeptide/nickel transport system permease subunit